jgi:hypothetical protein
MVSSVVWTSAEEHRRLKQGEDIKQELLLTIYVYELDIYCGETKCVRILVEKLKERDSFAEVGLNGRMILKGILKKQDCKASA